MTPYETQHHDQWVSLIFLTKTAGFERIFSATTFLKNERRNRVLDDMLNTNLHGKFSQYDLDCSSLETFVEHRLGSGFLFLSRHVFSIYDLLLVQRQSNSS